MFAELSTLVQRIIEHPGQAFRDVVPIALIGAGVVIVLHLVFTLFSPPVAPAPRTRWRLWERIVYLAALLSVALLAATAFYSVIRLGAMGGWLLFAHMIGAGAFVVALPLIAITWCEANRFGSARGERDSGADAQRFFWLTKLMFWLILAAGLVAASTMLASMLPMFGTEGLLRLLDAHRYSSLVVVVAMLFHFYGVGLQRFGRR